MTQAPVLLTDSDVRESMRRALPGFVQPFLTWLTAKPAFDEPYRARSPQYHVATACFSTLFGIGSSIALLYADSIYLLGLMPLAWIITTGGMGKAQAVIYHHCAHGNVFQKRWTNTLVGHAISVLLLVKDFHVYRREHLHHHRTWVLLTAVDEFIQFIDGMCRLKLGTPKRALIRQITLSFASPVFHLRFLFARFRGCLFARASLHSAFAIVFWGLLIGAVSTYNLWLEFAVAWLIPLFIPFQIATALRVLCEHRFPDAAILDQRGLRFICQTTAGAFPGAQVPSVRGWSARSIREWANWWALMLTEHLFSRVFVLVGDAPAHDYHHRRPNSKKWASHIHERHRETVNGSPKYPENFIENWGLFNAVGDTLQSLSMAGAEAFVTPAQVFLGGDHLGDRSAGPADLSYEEESAVVSSQGGIQRASIGSDHGRSGADAERSPDNRSPRSDRGAAERR